MRDRPVKAKPRGEADGEDADVAADGPAAPGDEETYYDAMKREMGGREARTRAALDALDPLQRVAMEGHRPGAYLRLRFSGAQPLCASGDGCCRAPQGGPAALRVCRLPQAASDSMAPFALCVLNARLVLGLMWSEGQLWQL